jgi:hypothetical protein
MGCSLRPHAHFDGALAAAGVFDGDVNGDSTVDINDLTVVLSSYNSSHVLSAAGIAAPVPEPSMLALFAGGLVALLAYAWRKEK